MQNAIISNNTGTAVQAFEAGVIELRGSTAVTVPAAGATDGALIQLGSTLRVRDTASIGATGHGIQASNNSVVDKRRWKHRSGKWCWGVRRSALLGGDGRGGLSGGDAERDADGCDGKRGSEPSAATSSLLDLGVGAHVTENALQGLLISGSKVRVLDGPPNESGISRTPGIPDSAKCLIVARYVQRLDEAYRRAGQRVPREVRDLSFISRCPRCGRIVRTPRARQCMWCHHDWHEAPGHR